jgi:hypothetical protein
MQCACFPLCCHLRPARLYNIFSHFLIHGTIFGDKKKLLNVNCVLWFSLKYLSETLLTVRRTARDIIINAHRSSCKVPAILVRCNQIWIFSTDFRNLLKHQTSWKSVNCEPNYSIRTERRRDIMPKLTVAFRNFSNAPHTSYVVSYFLNYVGIKITKKYICPNFKFLVFT